MSRGRWRPPPSSAWAVCSAEHYPLPIVEPAAAAREARERIWARRQELGFAELADAIQRRHGSRRSGLPPSGRGRRRRRSAPSAPSDQQLQLDLDLG
jgi:deoxyribodipyrimidine photo-lyase